MHCKCPLSGVKRTSIGGEGDRDGVNVGFVDGEDEAGDDESVIGMPAAPPIVFAPHR